MEVRHSNWLRSGWEVKYSATSIFAGEDGLYPSTGAVFSSASLPGLAGGGELFETSLFAEYDTRSGRTSPVRGFYVRASISSVDGVNGSDFSYWRYAVDQRFYVPLGNERRVFAVRTLLAFTDTRDDSQIPFFRLARLGDTQTLRGYDANRFYGRNAAAWNAEYRTDLTGGLGAFAFTDFGQVFDRASEFNTANFRVTYGGGVQLKTKKSIVLRTYVARSQERTRLMISFGPTF
jgi:outer membrane protein assembly factor BamA